MEGAALRIRSASGRWVLAATVMASGLTMLDATVVNIALPTIGADLGAGLTSLQWVVNAYTLALAGLLLLGGALGDRLGRRRVFLIGVAWFAIASLLCAVAPNTALLIAARALQGVGAALLAPGSLAILEASFHQDDRAAAIGAWSGLAGVMTAIGPFVGGWLVEAASWRLIFLINLPFAVAVVWIGLRHVPESRDEAAPSGIDYPGSVLVVAGLTGVVYGLTEGPASGWAVPQAFALAAGVVCLGVLVAVERSSPHPLLPPALFRSAQFDAANLVTFVVYVALSGAMFLLPMQLQIVVGFSPLASGAALLPVTLVMLVGSARAGRLATRIGPRFPMTAGPIVAAAGLATLAGVGAASGYWSGVFPGVAVFGVGLTLTVAPLTATVLAAAPRRNAGIASAVNNDVARTAGLLAVALLPVLAGMTNTDFGDPAAFSAGFETAMHIAAGTLAAGGVLSFATVRRPIVTDEPAVAVPTSHCALDASPLRVDAGEA